MRIEWGKREIFEMRELDSKAEKIAWFLLSIFWVGYAVLFVIAIIAGYEWLASIF